MRTATYGLFKLAQQNDFGSWIFVEYNNLSIYVYYLPLVYIACHLCFHKINFSSAVRRCEESEQSYSIFQHFISSIHLWFQFALQHLHFHLHLCAHHYSSHFSKSIHNIRITYIQNIYYYICMYIINTIHWHLCFAAAVTCCWWFCTSFVCFDWAPSNSFQQLICFTHSCIHYVHLYIHIYSATAGSKKPPAAWTSSYFAILKTLTYL